MQENKTLRPSSQILALVPYRVLTSNCCQTMRRILTILFFTFLTTGIFAKGGTGIYYIKGTAYGADKIVLKNAELIVDGSIVKTNDTGQFEIEVHWESACPSGITTKQWQRENARLNRKYIYIKYKDKEIKIKNEWEKYGDLFPESKDKVTMKKDLYFI